jgi:hypothetical protein
MSLSCVIKKAHNKVLNLGNCISKEAGFIGKSTLSCTLKWTHCKNFVCRALAPAHDHIFVNNDISFILGVEGGYFVMRREFTMGVFLRIVSFFCTVCFSRIVHFLFVVHSIKMHGKEALCCAPEIECSAKSLTHAKGGFSYSDG